jgi:N-acetylated-alpha-linked acidic dipeptidase
MNGVARDIRDPEKQITVWKRLQLQRIGQASSPEDRAEARGRADLRMGALGSGSDYTVFLDHLGIASLDLGFGGETGGGIYHSIYDDFYWYTHFDDTDFVYGQALAQTAGTAMMRLADAELLPFDFTNLSDTVSKYVDELQKLLKAKQDEIRERNRQIEEGVFTATADPHKHSVPPTIEPVPPYLSFGPLQNGAEALARSAAHYQAALAKLGESGGAPPDRAMLQRVNQKLLESERRLTDPEGLPGRPWFKHQIYAPGFYTGYGVKTIPAVREAIEQKRWKEADEQIIRVGRLLEAEAALIEEAAAALGRSE